MTLSFDDAARLRTSGFLDWEIEQFASATDAKGKLQPPIDLNAPVWQAAMKSRGDWVDDKIARGWTKEEIDGEIMGYYWRKAERSPFDFLKLEYAPPTKVDYREALRRRLEGEVAATLGRY